jgi:ribosome-binding protein aMBF1 (putative translation factor)
MNFDQDWKPVVLKKKKTEEDKKKKESGETVRKNIQPNKQSTSTMNKKDANDFDPENIVKPVTSTKDLGIEIQKARLAKGLTQVALNNLCNFPSNTIRDYENGSAKVMAEQINTMNRILEVKLPRPSKN